MKAKQLVSALLATLSFGVAHAAEFYQGPALGNLYINMISNFNAVSVTGYTGAGGQFSGLFYNGQADSFVRFFCIELNQPKSGSYPAAARPGAGFGGPMTGAMRSLM